MKLTTYEQSMLDGFEGEDKQFAMKLIVQVAEAMDAPRLQEITQAHVVDTLTTGTGETGPEYAYKLRDMQAKVAVPTTINVGNIDLKNPENNVPAEYAFEVSREIMNIYKDMGCEPTYTCSPFQEPTNQLSYGQHVAWGESSAIPFANSVFGARTSRYGQFIASCASICGRVPYAGLHVSENRRAEIVVSIENLPGKFKDMGLFYHILGYRVGQIVGEKIPVIVGVDPDISRDHLKAFGAAAATSGGIGMFHMIGITPEADTLEEALQKQAAEDYHEITLEELNTVLQQLTENEVGKNLEAVAFGAPHLSYDEVVEIFNLFEKVDWKIEIPVYIAMSRRTQDDIEANGMIKKFDEANITIVADRCVYYAGILWDDGLRVMTDSAKWAHYAPKCIDAEVTIGSFKDCVDSAVVGKVVLQGFSEEE